MQIPQTFSIHGFDADAATGKVLFSYAFENGLSFVEEIDFGTGFDALDTQKQQALQACLGSLSVAVGISYYKAFVPPKIDVSKSCLNDVNARFFSDFYYQGLGEFAARNQLDLQRLKQATHFEAGNTKLLPKRIELQDRPLVLIGGGKDSNVSIEALRDHFDGMHLLAVNPSQSIKECIAASELPAIVIQRKLDPKLFELNNQGAYNGHVPITGIISLIAIAVTIIYDFNAVVLSNERSANEETLEYQGEKINHQYSKSFEVEKGLQSLVHETISPDISYFSFLRPLSELHIAKLFAKSDRYDGVFTSCNGAHKLREDVSPRWCLDCPKCHFTFLMLATVMAPERLTHIFGKDILADPTKIMPYRELCGLQGHKPWECVGELEESAAAFYVLTQNPDWQDHHIVQLMLTDLQKAYTDLPSILSNKMMPIERHLLPSKYLEALNAYLGK